MATDTDPDLVGWPAWSAQVNDVVGGWVVTTYPKGLSEHDLRPDGDPMKHGYVIAECMSFHDAAKIAHDLNTTEYVPEIPASEQGRWRWVTVGYIGKIRSRPRPTVVDLEPEFVW